MNDITTREDDSLAHKVGELALALHTQCRMQIHLSATHT